MASTFPESYNPFEAPATTLGGTLAGPADTDIEQIRRRYLGHEASVRSVGMLAYVGAFFGALGTLGYLGFGIFMMVSPPPQMPNMPINPGVFFIIAGVVAAVFTMIYGGLGYGLRRLQTWARWVMIVLCGLSLLYVLVICGVALAMDPVNGGIMAGIQTLGALIPGYILYLMASAKGGVVFSPGYREVVRQTPHIRYKTSLFVKILLGFFVGLILLAIIAAIVGGAKN